MALQQFRVVLQKNDGSRRPSSAGLRGLFSLQAPELGFCERLFSVTSETVTIMPHCSPRTVIFLQNHSKLLQGGPKRGFASAARAPYPLVYASAATAPYPLAYHRRKVWCGVSSKRRNDAPLPKVEASRGLHDRFGAALLLRGEDYYNDNNPKPIRQGAPWTLRHTIRASPIAGERLRSFVRARPSGCACRRATRR